MSSIPLNASLTSQSISQNLGLEDVNQVNDIKVIVEGFHEEAQKIASFAETATSNMYIETANENYLDLVGSQEGLYRTKEPSLKVFKEDEALYLTLQAQDIFGDFIKSTPLTLKKGLSLNLKDNGFTILLDEDLDFSSIKLNEKVFLSATLKPLMKESLTLPEGFEVEVYDLPVELQQTIKTLRIGSNRDLNIQVVEEPISNFRERLIYSRTVPKYAAETAIRIAVSSNPLVHQHVINEDVYPFVVTIFNNSLPFSDDFRGLMEEYAIAQISTAIAMRKAFGTTFAINIAQAVRFNLRAFDGNGDEIQIDMSDFRSYILGSYALGKEITVDITMVNMFLASRGFTTFAGTISIYKFIEGYKYLSKDISVIIGPTEYPFYMVENYELL